MTLALETRPISAGRGRRPRRVWAGEGMVEPTERLIVQHEDGRTEELLPGRDRLTRDYPWVRKHPEWFTPADRQDTETYRRHRHLLEVTRRRIEREIAGTTTRASTSTRPGRFRLPDGPRGRFHLP